MHPEEPRTTLMAHFVSVPQFVEAWRVPYWGHAADEPAPLWLTCALQDDAIFINHLGGLTRRTLFGDENCWCGDYAVLGGDQTIQFVSADDFAREHERVRL